MRPILIIYFWCNTILFLINFGNLLLDEYPRQETKQQWHDLVGMICNVGFGFWIGVTLWL